LNWFIQRLDKAVSIVLVTLVTLMVLCITTEIVLNACIQPMISYLLNTSPSLESSLQSLSKTVSTLSAPVNTLSQTLLVWVGILGSAYALRRREHLGVDALVRLYPASVRFWLDRISTLLVALFSGSVLLVGGYLVVSGAFTRGFKMPGIEWLNQGWFYVVLVITGVLNLIYCIDQWVHPKPVESWDAKDEGAASS
jgi:TRAP-type C4-dicarboxylate transport system permease small subunit